MSSGPHLAPGTRRRAAPLSESAPAQDAAASQAVDGQREGAPDRAVRPLLAQYFLAFANYFSLTPVLAVLVRQGWHQAGAVAGLALLAFSVSARAGSIVLSRWLDGQPGIRMLAIANVLTGTCFLATAAVSMALPLILLLAAGGTGVSVNGLIVRSVVAQRATGSRSRVTAFAKLNVMLNLAAAIGPIIGTTLFDAAAPWRLMVVLAGGYYVAAVFALTAVSSKDSGLNPGAKRFSLPRYWAALRSSAFLRQLMAASTVGWVLYAQLYSALPLYLFSVIGSRLQVATYFTMGAILIVLLQVPVSKLVTALLARGADLSTMLCAGVSLFAIAFSVLALAHGNEAVIYGAVAIFTLGEMLFAPSVDTAFMAAAEESAISFVATYTGKQFTLAVGEGLGAFVGGGLFVYVKDAYSPSAYWASCAALGVLAACALSVRRVRGSRARAGRW